MKLDELVAKRVQEFAFIMQPLKLEGATGSVISRTHRRPPSRAHPNHPISTGKTVASSRPARAAAICSVYGDRAWEMAERARYRTAKTPWFFGLKSSKNL
jgi:hypothetical protein